MVMPTLEIDKQAGIAEVLAAKAVIAESERWIHDCIARDNTGRQLDDACDGLAVRWDIQGAFEKANNNQGHGWGWNALLNAADQQGCTIYGFETHAEVLNLCDDAIALLKAGE